MPLQTEALIRRDASTPGMSERPNIVRFALPVEPTAAGIARERVRAVVRSDSELRTDLELLLSEVVTNVVKHSGLTPSGSMDVELVIRPEHVMVAVSSVGEPFPEALLEPIHRTHPSEGGYGLFLLDRIATRWGASSGGATVWFELEGSTHAGPV